MSAEDAKKLISEGLAKLQEGLNQLCESVDDLENPDRPAPGSLAAQIQEAAAKKKP